MDNKPLPPMEVIRYGSLYNENEWVNWVVKMVDYAIAHPNLKANVANEIYDNVSQMGYDWGVDSAAEDAAWEA